MDRFCTVLRVNAIIGASLSFRHIDRAEAVSNIGPNCTILVALERNWDVYHTNSPYNLLNRVQAVGFPVHPVEMPDDQEAPDAWMTVRRHWDAEAGDVLKNCDAIICDEHTYQAFPDVRCLRLLLLNDIHCWDTAHLEFRMAALRWCDYALSAYLLSSPEDVLLSIPRKARNNFLFFPHYVSDASFFWQPVDERLPIVIPGSWKDTIHNTNSGYDALYPLRVTCHRTSIFKESCRASSKIQGNALYREKFSQLLSRYLIGVTCNLTLDYSIAKYFEIPASGALLYAGDIGSELERHLLGFDESNAFLVPKEKNRDIEYHERCLRELVADRERVADLAQCGQALIRRRHRLQHRLDYLQSLVSRIIEGRFVIADQFDLFAASVNKGEKAFEAPLRPACPPQVRAQLERQYRTLNAYDAESVEAFWMAVSDRLNEILPTKPGLDRLESWIDTDFAADYGGLSIVDRARKGAGYRFRLEGYSIAGGYFGVMRPTPGPDVPAEDTLRQLGYSRGYTNANEGWVFYSKPGNSDPIMIDTVNTAFAELNSNLVDHVVEVTLALLLEFAPAFFQAMAVLED